MLGGASFTTARLARVADNQTATSGGESLHLGMTSATGIPPCSSDASCKLPVAKARIGRNLSNTQKVYALALHEAVDASMLDESLLAGIVERHAQTFSGSHSRRPHWNQWGFSVGGRGGCRPLHLYGVGAGKVAVTVADRLAAPRAVADARASYAGCCPWPRGGLEVQRQHP